jgi:hypothetical protein
MNDESLTEWKILASETGDGARSFGFFKGLGNDRKREQKQKYDPNDVV